jgi:NAD(P)-dependent dehydrogenase (short-subunit alcohol dehydrogenase family)
MPDTTFFDKVCIVTGAASGLGRALSRRLAAAGATVVMADIDERRLEQAAATLAGTGGSLRTARCDVTDAQSVRGLIEGAAAEFGRIDYLFNNAGAVMVGEVRDLSLEQWRRVIEINLFGVIHGIHHAYPIMIAQGSGHIVNVASGFGMAPGPLNSPYVASKFAVFGLSHALAAEAKAFGVHVSLVCPGYIETPLIERMAPARADGAAVRDQIPVKLVPVERAARIVLAGVAGRRMVIAFPGYVRLLAFLHRFAPALFAHVSARQIERFRTIRKVEA